jgi:hypothetical protein
LYLEVGIGPDAEVFTKAPTLSAVGAFMDADLHPKSTWNNPASLGPSACALSCPTWPSGASSTPDRQIHDKPIQHGTEQPVPVSAAHRPSFTHAQHGCKGLL